MNIVTVPAESLLEKSASILSITPTISDLIAKMFALMQEHNGAGLAAPQVGKNIRLFVCAYGPSVFINPKISFSQGEQTGEEGCLSIPDKKFLVPRAKHVKVVATEITGKLMEHEAKGELARIWQHEIDHLDGLLIDRFPEIPQEKQAEANPVG
jgi:peptide deformylase